jgi:hypothetical protein
MANALCRAAEIAERPARVSQACIERDGQRFPRMFPARWASAWNTRACRGSAKARQRRTLSASMVALPDWISQPALYGVFRVGVGRR